MKDFISLYGAKLCITRPTGKEFESLNLIWAVQVFQGCVGTLDCCRLTWKNCPVMWKLQYHTNNNGTFATYNLKSNLTAHCISGTGFLAWPGPTTPSKCSPHRRSCKTSTERRSNSVWNHNISSPLALALYVISLTSSSTAITALVDIPVYYNPPSTGSIFI